MADISNYLQVIAEATSGEDVRDAIVSCMNEINKDTAFTVTNKVIRENLSQMNKTYSAPSGQVWKQVTLDITDDSSGEKVNNGSSNVIDLEVNNSTENGTKNAKEMYGENAVWGDVIVNIDHSGDWEGISDNEVISTNDLDNGTWHAETRGLTAVKSITFSDAKSVTQRGGTIGPGGVAQFPVVFYNDKNKSSVNEKLTVPQGSDASLYKVQPNPTDTMGGLPFAGWSPSTQNIQEAMEFIPVFKAGTHGEGEYAEDWTAIVANRGQKMAIGQYKNVTFPIVRTNVSGATLYSEIKNSGGTPYHFDVHDSREYLDGAYYSPVSINFMKVAEENGGSTFLATKAIATSGAQLIPLHTDDVMPPTGVSDDGGWDHWDSGYAKQWLDKCILPLFPTALKQGIKSVTKSTKGANTALERTTHNQDDGTSLMRTSTHRLWVPSIAEVASFDNFRTAITNASFDGLADIYDTLVSTFESADIDYANNCPEWVNAVKQNYTNSSAVAIPLRSSFHAWGRNAGNSNYFQYCLTKFVQNSWNKDANNEARLNVQSIDGRSVYGVILGFTI